MIKELKREKEIKDEVKLMNAIHQNCKDVRVERQMNDQIKQIEQTEKEVYYKRWNKILFFTILGGLLFEILILILGW